MQLQDVIQCLFVDALHFGFGVQLSMYAFGQCPCLHVIVNTKAYKLPFTCERVNEGCLSFISREPGMMVHYGEGGLIYLTFNCFYCASVSLMDGGMSD